MVHGQNPPVGEILNAHEIAVTRMMQVHYGGEVKLAAAVFADTVSLDEPAREAFIGSIATALDGVHFERRRAAALRLREAAEALGGPAVEGALDVPLQEMLGVAGGAAIMYE
ncbi:MAG TPA: hypothetical protein VII55_00980, partial [Candidatus Saccharimonadales bacterium]